jgi:hypothetical protein
VFFISDWYWKDFSRMESAMSTDGRMVSAHVPWLVPMLQATLAVFLAVIPATFITRYFRSSHGELEFSALGIKFKGPAGPILLWVVSFLAVAAFILLLLRVLILSATKP